MKKPSCIHIPELKVEQPAQIVWAMVDGASEYILERRLVGAPFPDEFEVTKRVAEYARVGCFHGGLYWSDIEDIALSWLGIASKSLNWHQIAAKGIDLAYDWREIGNFAKAWADIATASFTWRNIATAIEKAKEHSYCIDIVPDKAKFAEYRVKAVGSDNESEYRYSGLLRVKSKIETEDDISRFVTAGEREYFVLNADSARLFEDAMTLSYDPAALELTSFTAHIPECSGEDSLLDIVSQENGQVSFHCTRQIPEEKEWSGLVTLLMFQALQTGETRLQLR